MYLKKIILIITAFLSLTVTITISAQIKLIMSIDLIRHGDRTAIVAFLKAPYREKIGSGELTAKGMQQEFQLGRRLRKIYVENYHLLPSRYHKDTLYVRSTDFDRTLMSAQAFLLGLYPLGTGPYLDARQSALPAAYQPIPIHTVPQELDNLFFNDGKESAGRKYLATVANYFQQAIQMHSPLKCILFFAHDSSIKNVMLVLQAPQNIKIPYASDLNFSLFESDKKNYYVTLQFNGKQLAIPTCNVMPCSLKNFLRFVKENRS